MLQTLALLAVPGAALTMFQCGDLEGGCVP